MAFHVDRLLADNLHEMLSYTSPDSLVVKASASGAGGRRFESQCRQQWGSF